jgi:hypothetical protein
MEQAPKKSRETSSPTKGRGRPKGSKNKSKSQAIVKTKFGTIIPNLPPYQRKALGNLLFAGSAPNTVGKLPNSIFQADGLNAGRQLPQNDVKSDHLLFKEVHLVKNITTGDWEVESVTTNQGKFETGVEQTKKINQALVRAFVTYLRQHVFENDIKTFLEQEKL